MFERVVCVEQSYRATPIVIKFSEEFKMTSELSSEERVLMLLSSSSEHGCWVTTGGAVGLGGAGRGAVS